MSGPITAWATWLQRNLGAAAFPCDHPSLAACAGWHKPQAPCDGKRGKHPACSWARDSTTDPDRLASMLGAGPRNIGVDTLKSGLLVIDEDKPGLFTRYAAGLGQVIPATFTVSTAQGRHFYFRQHPGEPHGNGTGLLPAGIDVRGRGYVIAPGSLHASGVIYTPDGPVVPPAPAPGWLLAVLRPPARLATTPARLAPGSVTGRLAGLLAVVLDAEPGTRNSKLFWASCRAAEMAAAGEVDEATAVSVLTEAARAAGLGPGETAATIASAMRQAVTR